MLFYLIVNLVMVTWYGIGYCDGYYHKDYNDALLYMMITYWGILLLIYGIEFIMNKIRR